MLSYSKVRLDSYIFFFSIKRTTQTSEQIKLQTFHFLNSAVSTG